MPPRIRTLGYYLQYRKPVLGIVSGVWLLVATVILLSSYSDKWDVAILTGVLGVMSLALGIFLFLRVHRGMPIATTLDEALEKAPSPAHAAGTIRQYMWGITIIFGLYGAWEANDLMQLEFGWDDSVPVSKPVAYVYAAFGFWPAVLLIPGVGLAILLYLARKLRDLKEQQAGRI